MIDERTRRDEIWALNLASAKDEGLAQGIEQGLSQGLAQGKLDLIRTMLSNGADLAIVSQYTGISLTDLEGLLAGND